MLMMKLTDGVVEVSGMEYRNIPILNNNLLPGLKVSASTFYMLEKDLLGDLDSLSGIGQMQIMASEVCKLWRRKYENAKNVLFFER